MAAIQFSSWQLQPGVHLHVAPTEKFKTIRIRVAFQTPLTRESATANALIPMVLRRGSTRFPTLRDLAKHLETLYGSAFGFDTRKMGESQIVEAQFHVPSERFLPDATGLLREAVEFLAEILLNPITTPGQSFLPAYVKSERDALRQKIDGLVDERFQYAVERCYSHMCSDEPFGIYRYGSSEDLVDIDARSLYESYQRLLSEAAVHIIVVGAVDADEVRDLFSSLFILPRSTLTLPESPQPVLPSKVRTKIERMDVLQGVLVIGCRLPLRYSDEEYPALLMYNGILGGFSHSKLFMEVRERKSLAYTAFSRMETVKGVQILFAGIDVDRFEQASDIMLQQLEEIRHGNITEAELSATRSALINGLRSGLDEAGQIIQNRLIGEVAGRYRDVEETVQALSEVRVDQIVQVAERVVPDTIYFLRDHGGEG